MQKVLEIETGESIIIRHISESDIDGVWDNFNEVVNEGIYLPVFFPVRSDFEKQSWFNWLKREKELCIVAINPKLKGAHKVIGQCEIMNLDWDAGIHVGRLGIIVQKNYRNNGIGLSLIDMAIRDSKRINDKEKIILSCFSNNERALHLYKKMGFRVVGTRKKQFIMDSKYYDEVLLELFISEYLKNYPENQ